ncbi:MAG: ROK family protein [Gordonibacter sp.]|uniref:ROK family protein n=2 Tax=Gordonibacter sp. TaxID=1968902 RepID=UPI002FCA231B
MRERIFQIVQRARPGDRVSHAYDIFIVVIAFLSIIPLMFRPQDAGPRLTAVLNMVDVVSVYILFFDYLMRWATHDIKTGKKGWKEFAKYPFSPLAIIDLLAILPSLGVLPETFKFLRVLRVTKMFRYSKNLTIVANVFRSEKNTLLSVLVVALMYIFVSGLIMFVNEPDTFDNFFDALYWATTALTTVGYGDVYPVTDLGKFISMVSSLFGIAIIALPAGIITGGFLEQIRRSQENREGYFRPEELHCQKPFKGCNPRSYGSVRAYLKAHPKMVAYAATMAACLLTNEVLYAVSVAFGTPLWLDTVGTALAAILLEPTAGLIIAFVNNLVQAIQFGNAGNLLYSGMGAIAALVFGVLFARGKKITSKSLGWAALFLVGAGGLISCILTFSLYGGALSTPTQQLYYDALGTLGLSGVPAVVIVLFADKVIDAVAVFVLVMLASRGIIGSRIDPKRWFGAKKADDRKAANAKVAEEEAPGDPVQYVLGIDVGGTSTKIGAFKMDGRLVASHVFGSQRVLDDGSHGQLADEVGVLLGQSDINAGQVAAVGLAVPGAIAAEESLKMCPHLDLDLRSYKAFLRSLFPKARVAVLNDADAAVLGDRWCGSSSDLDESDVAFVTLGTGIGAGVMVRGRLLAGAHGAAGEFGHLCVNPAETQLCSCGKAGCLEQYASASGLVNAARESFVARLREGEGAERAQAPAQPQTGLETCPQASAQTGQVQPVDDMQAQAEARRVFPDARSVLDAADRHDPVAQEALDRLSDALGFGLAQMACLVDPDLFVLGGGLSERADLFLDAVGARYRAYALPVCRDTPVVASSLGNECGIYGAAYRAFETLHEGEGPSG